MTGWVPATVAIVTVEAVCARRHTPLLSHDYWAGLDTPARPLLYAGWTVLTVHLNARQNWPRSLAYGAAVGAFAHWTRRRRNRG